MDAEACLNCGAALSGPYCASCGQKTPHTDLSLREFLHDATAELTQLQGKVPKTLKALLRRALGATDRSIVQLLLGQGGRQLGLGALVALPAMLLVGAGFSHFFPIGLGVSAALGLLVTAAIVAVVLVATYVPTRQALAVTFRDVLRRD